MSEDNSWVFDSLVCFLHGPIWNVPLQTFIEEKSYVFDPNEKTNEINSTYQKIHEEYKTLVDYMLGSFMDEMQITPEQFEIACLEGRNQNQQSSSENPFNFHQGLFQQIWAANDIKIFIRMMKQRNIELQLQALDLIERKQHSVSLSEEDSKKNKKNEENLEEKIISEENLCEENINKIVENELDSTKPAKDEESNEQKQEDKFERLNLFFKNKEINPDDVQARQEYLRAQRDKILEIKKKARTKQLNDSMKKTNIVGDGGAGRPTSARVAQKILEGNNVNEVMMMEQNNAVSIVNPASELRKTLAKRLKAEVVDKN